MTSRPVTECILCTSTVLDSVIDLGLMPLPNQLPCVDDPFPDPAYPLACVICRHCCLMQLDHVVPPEEMFTDYSYSPRPSRVLHEHFQALAEKIQRLTEPVKNPRILDIGCNDGLLLEKCKMLGAGDVLGIDPALNRVDDALARGIKVLPTLFPNPAVIETMVEQGGFTVVTATNCLAHTANLREFLKGIQQILAPDGVAIIEVPNVRDLLNGHQFDTIYHEHQSYFSLTPLAMMLPELGLMIWHVEPVAVQGGSMRIYLKRLGADVTTVKVEEWLAWEREWRVFDPDTYTILQQEAERVRLDVLGFVKKNLNMEGRIAGIGASAKASILLNYASIDELIYVTDANPDKQGRMIPGMRIPIVPESRLAEDIPDVILCLAWNLLEDAKRVRDTYRPLTPMWVVIPELREVVEN